MVSLRRDRQKNYLMKYNVFTISPFDKQLKRLAKKFPSLKVEYAALIEDLEENPQKGLPLGNNCFKICLSIAPKGRGKSGNLRVITHFYAATETVFFLAIYVSDEEDKKFIG